MAENFQIKRQASPDNFVSSNPQTAFHKIRVERHRFIKDPVAWIRYVLDQIQISWLNRQTKFLMEREKFNFFYKDPPNSFIEQDFIATNPAAGGRFFACRGKGCSKRHLRASVSALWARKTVVIENYRIKRKAEIRIGAWIWIYRFEPSWQDVSTWKRRIPVEPITSWIMLASVFFFFFTTGPSMENVVMTES